MFIIILIVKQRHVYSHFPSMRHIKCVLVGDDGIKENKTLLLVTYTTNANLGDYIPTVFDNCSVNMVYEGQHINLQLWSTASSEDYKKLRPLSYPQTDVFIALFSLTYPETFEDIRNIWIPEVRERCPNTPIILCGSSLDSMEEVENNPYIAMEKGWEPVNQIEIDNLVKEFNLDDYFAVSAKDIESIKELFNGAIKAVIRSQKRDAIEQIRRNFKVVQTDEIYYKISDNDEAIVIGIENKDPIIPKTVSLRLKKYPVTEINLLSPGFEIINSRSLQFHKDSLVRSIKNADMKANRNLDIPPLLEFISPDVAKSAVNLTSINIMSPEKN